MSLYGVRGVQLDTTSRVTKLAMQGIDGTGQHWIGQPMLVDVSDVADMIAAGDKVVPIFEIDGQTVPGPAFRRVEYESGIEGVELEADVPRQRMSDLVQIGQ